MPAVLVLTTRLNCIARNPSRRDSWRECWQRQLPMPWPRQCCATTVPALSAATITAWLCSTQATWASSSVMAGLWGKVSPERNTGSRRAHTAGQSAGS
jgi:hypothetical protein